MCPFGLTWRLLKIKIWSNCLLKQVPVAMQGDSLAGKSQAFTCATSCHLFWHLSLWTRMVLLATKGHCSFHARHSQHVKWVHVEVETLNKCPWLWCICLAAAHVAVLPHSWHSWMMTVLLEQKKANNVFLQPAFHHKLTMQANQVDEFQALSRLWLITDCMIVCQMSSKVAICEMSKVCCDCILFCWWFFNSRMHHSGHLPSAKQIWCILLTWHSFGCVLNSNLFWFDLFVLFFASFMNWWSCCHFQGSSWHPKCDANSCSNVTP